MSQVVLESQVYTKLKLVVDDPAFLSDAVYPVVIDPSVFPTQDSFVKISSNLPDTYMGSDSYEDQIYGSPNGYSDTYIDYVAFNTASVPSTAIVNAAQLTLKSMGQLGEYVNTYYDCKRLTSPLGTPTWNNRPSVTDVNSQRSYSYPASNKLYAIGPMLNDAVKNSNPFTFEISGDRYSYSGFYTNKDYPAQLIVDYTVNMPPTVDRVINVEEYTLFTETATNQPFQVLINDPAGGSVSVQLYVDGVFRETKSGKAPLFGVNMAELTDGEHKLRFVATDGYATAEKTFTYTNGCLASKRKKLFINDCDIVE